MKPSARDIKQELKNAKTKLAIVEGKKDIQALKKLGFINILSLQEPFYKVIEKIDEKEVIILTDFDAKGKQLYAKIKQQLDKRGIKVDNKLRHLLFRSRLSHIEGIGTFLRNLEESR